MKSIAAHVIVKNEGVVVEMADSDDNYRNPREEYTRKLLASIPKGLQRAAELE